MQWLFILIPILVILIFAFIIKYKEIMSFLYPGDWLEVEILELDNNTFVDLIKKPSNLVYHFRDGSYNLYHASSNTGKDKFGRDIPVLQKNSPIYRSGRLGKFFFIEGNSDPLDFRNNEIKGNAYVSDLFSKVEFARLFESDVSFGEDFLKKYGFFVLVGIVVILGVLLLRG